LFIIHKNYVKKGRDEVLDMKGVFKGEFQPIFLSKFIYFCFKLFFFVFLDHFDVLVLKIKYKKNINLIFLSEKYFKKQPLRHS
jgi:hypothetical protein